MPDEQPTTLSTIVGGGLRSIAASFPGLASLGQAWSEYENHQTAERITELIENLRTRVETLSSRIDNFEEICAKINEEFPSLLEITIDKVRKEFSQAKREMYAGVLASLLFQQFEDTYESKTAVLHSLDALYPDDLEVLKLFRGREESAAKELDWQSLNLSGDNNHKLAELASMLAKLESRGLIVTIRLPSMVVYPPAGVDSSVARLSETQYKILPLGKKILATLE